MFDWTLPIYGLDGGCVKRMKYNKYVGFEKNRMYLFEASI